MKSLLFMQEKISPEDSSEKQERKNNLKGIGSTCLSINKYWLYKCEIFALLSLNWWVIKTYDNCPISKRDTKELRFVNVG